MTVEVKVPTLPESVADATIAQWYKKAGDSVKRDENLVDLETDKVMLEVPAPSDGVLAEILINITQMHELSAHVLTGGEFAGSFGALSLAIN